MNMFTRFVKDESGATAIEYGLIAALLSVVIITGLQVAGPALEGTFTTVGNTLSGGTTSTDTTTQ